MTTTPPTGPNAWQRLPMLTRAGLIATGIFGVIGLVTAGLPGLLINVGLVAFFTAMFALSTNRKSWLQVQSGAVGAALLVGAVVLCGMGAAGTSITNASNVAARTDVSDSGSTPTESASPTPTATTAPAMTTKTVIENKEIPFESTTIDDAALAAGTTAVTTPGVVGTRTIQYKVTYRDGVEVSREVVSDQVTSPPVTEVVSNGTYVAPAPVPFVADGSGCDPNYDGCVPIASDVDCEGGGGNGPAYVSGTVNVIGSDIYGLDRNGDGIGCN